MVIRTKDHIGATKGKCERVHDGFRKTKAGTELEISLELIGLVGHITLKTVKTLIKGQIRAKIKKL